MYYYFNYKINKLFYKLFNDVVYYKNYLFYKERIARKIENFYKKSTKYKKIRYYENQKK